MAIKGGLFPTVGTDRPYYYYDYNDRLKWLASSGVLTRGQALTTEMEVSPVSATMKSSVNLGAYNIEGVLAEIHTDAEEVTHDTADVTNPRIDVVAIQRDFTVGVRSVSIVIVKGTPGASPAVPPLTQDATTWQEALAEVTIPANETDADNFSYNDVRAASQSLVTTPVSNVPVGGVMEWYTNICPDGYIWAEGQAVSRTTYAALFALWGETFGAGDGSTTFNVIDKRELVAAGYKSGSAEFGVLGGSYGEKEHQLTVGELAAHGHTQSAHVHTINHNHSNEGSHKHPLRGEQVASGSGAVAASNYTGSTGPWETDNAIHSHTYNGNSGSATATNQNTGHDDAHNNIQPTIAARFIIKT